MLTECTVITIYALIACFACSLAVDINHTGITVVSDDTRFHALHPNAVLEAFHKERHVKGNIVFSAGERISGDRVILVFTDTSQFTRAEDIEDQLRYTSDNGNGEVILTFVQIVADLTSQEADSYFFGGGIDKSYADILLVCNQTQRFNYEIFIYGY